MLVNKYHLLDYIQSDFKNENIINPARIFILKEGVIERNKTAIYLVTREFRCYDNFAFDYLLMLKEYYNLNIEVIFKLPKFEIKKKQEFFDINYGQIKNDYINNNVKIKEYKNKNEILNYLKNLKPTILITDFNPIEKFDIEELEFKIVEIDGHNIVPARYVSNKQEYGAAFFRKKIYSYIGEFLTEYPNSLKITPLSLADFIKNRLDYYARDKNNPTKFMTSRLSPYINFGFISSQRIALEIAKASCMSLNKEVFLEELIVRKELADNFCLYCKNFKTFDCVSLWARQTLSAHKNDIRTQLFSLKELENAQTNDDLWNAAQKQLLKEGRIEGYLRMYWAKQLLFWTLNPNMALNTAVYLNDKYAYDAPSANGYTAILWSLGGVHDRPFADRPIIGKIRPMTYNGAKAKFKIKEYINKY